MSEMTMGVVDQVTLALRPKSRLATTMGFLLGGFVPVATYMVAHYEYDTTRAAWSQLATALILGGLAYSAKTVFEWGRRAFQAGFKAGGFVLLIEGVMILSHNAWLSFVALGYLVAINGIATGCTLALDRAKKPRAAKPVATAVPVTTASSTRRLRAVGGQ